MSYPAPAPAPKDISATIRLLKKMGECLSNMETGFEPLNPELYLATAKMVSKMLPAVLAEAEGARVVLHCSSLWEMVDGGPRAIGFCRVDLMELLHGNKCSDAKFGLVMPTSSIRPLAPGAGATKVK